MTTFRVMSYNVRRCRGRDGATDPARIAAVIGEGAPDIVALQEVDGGQLDYLAGRLAMRPYGDPGPGGTALLSYYPLRGVRRFDLGSGGSCLLADADPGGRRLHLLDVSLSPVQHLRGRQVATLLGPDILGNRSLGCPVLLVGDFADLLGGAGMALSLSMRRAPRPFWSATYPAPFPLVGRDRAYLRGDLRVVDSRVLRSSLARRASSHLPLVLTVQVNDPRSYLRIGKLARNRMEVAPG